MGISVHPLMPIACDNKIIRKQTDLYMCGAGK